MSQTDLQSLLYNALASGSQFEADGYSEPAAELARRCDEAALDLVSPTPAEIIAHYDFRVRATAQAY